MPSAVGVVVFSLASLACGLAPNLALLVVARFVQGTAAAVMMPSSMALIGQAYTDARERARAVARLGDGRRAGVLVRPDSRWRADRGQLAA